MKNKQDNWFEQLRHMAGQEIKIRPGHLENSGSADLTRLIDEIQVFQVELELQNEELRSSLEELEKSRNRFSRLFDMAPAGYVVIDDAGMILHVNQTLMDMLKKSPDALLGKPFSRFIAPEDQGVFLSRFAAFYKHPADKTLEVRLNSDGRFVCHARLQGGFIPFETDPGKPDIEQFCLIVTDITENKTAETELKIYAQNLNERNKELNCLYSIARLISNPDLGVGDIMGRAILLLVNGLQYPDMACGRITLPGNTYETPHFKETPQRLSRDILLKGRAFGRIDIHYLEELFFIQEEADLVNSVALRLGHAIERFQAETKETQIRQYLETILKTTADGFWVLDTQGNIIEANDAFCRMTGYPKTALLKMTIKDLDDIECPEETAARIGRIVTHGSEFFETRHRRSDGATFPIEVSVTWMAADGGRLICFGRDITERKQAEKRILNLQKTESLGRMAGAIAHHYNNLLTTVMGNLEMALYDIPADSREGGYLKEAMDAAQRISKLGNTMLTYLGQSNKPRKRLDLSETCRDAVSSFQTDLSPQISLETEFPLPGPAVLANAGQIRQILDIFITNATEAMEDRPGAIVLGILPALPGDIASRHRYPVDFHPGRSNYICIRIQDAGPGIPKTDLEKIFDPFYSTKLTGRGLGLPIALGTVKSLGGCITVATTPHSGTVFHVFIPSSN
jgi:PAS domain S-box-containing protein